MQPPISGTQVLDAPLDPGVEDTLEYSGSLRELSDALQALLIATDKCVFPTSPPLELSLAVVEETPEDLVPYELLEPLHLPSEALYGDDLEQFYPHPLDAKDKTPSAQVVDYSQVMRAVSRSWPPSKRPTSSPALSLLSLVVPLARASISDVDLFRGLGSSDVRIHPTAEFKSWTQQLGVSNRVVNLLEENAGASAYELVAMADPHDGLPGVLTILIGVHALRCARPDA